VVEFQRSRWGHDLLVLGGYLAVSVGGLSFCFALTAGAESAQVIDVAAVFVLFIAVPLGLIVLFSLRNVVGSRWVRGVICVSERPAFDVLAGRLEVAFRGGLRSARPTRGGLRIRTGLSAYSFGERITVKLSDELDSFRVTIRSTSVVPFNVMNDRVNECNVEAVIQALLEPATR
jgi:hypothetical protein